MEYEIKRRIKVLSSMLAFCVVFLSVVVLARYGLLQMKSGKKIQSANDFTPLNVGDMNRQQKDSLKDVLQN